MKNSAKAGIFSTKKVIIKCVVSQNSIELKYCRNFIWSPNFLFIFHVCITVFWYNCILLSGTLNDRIIYFGKFWS